MKTQKIILTIALAAIFILQLFTFFNQSSESSTIAYVESSRLLDNYKGMIDARKAFETKAKTWQANIDTLTTDLKTSIQQFERDKKSMTEKEVDLSKQLLKKKQEELNNYKNAIQQKAAQEDNVMTQKVLTELNAYIKQYGEHNEYKIIMAATDFGNIAYASEGVDITDEILEGLNGRYNGK